MESAWDDVDIPRLPSGDERQVARDRRLDTRVIADSFWAIERAEGVREGGVDLTIAVPRDIESHRGLLIACEQPGRLRIGAGEYRVQGELKAAAFERSAFGCRRVE